MPGRRPLTDAQREAADESRRATLEAMHGQLSAGIGQLDNLEGWQQWLSVAHRFHRYSFNNSMLIMLQTGGQATAVAGYRAWQALGYQVRRGEKAIKVMGPILSKTEKLDPRTGDVMRGADGEPLTERRMVGVKPVSVFDASQVEPPPPTPPQPTLLTGQAPDGLWDALAAMVAARGYDLARGECGGANGVTDFGARRVTVRDDVDDAQAVKTLAHELGHVLLTTPDNLGRFDSACRGLREVEAESVAYMVTQAHGLDSAQYTFSYVAGWASSAVAEGETVADVIQRTGERVIGAVDEILSNTLPAGLDVMSADAVASDLGITGNLQPAPAAAGVPWEVTQDTLQRSVEAQTAIPPALSPASQPALVGL